MARLPGPDHRSTISAALTGTETQPAGARLRPTGVRPPTLALAAAVLVGLSACSQSTAGPPAPVATVEAVDAPASGLQPPPGVDTAVLCLTPFEGPLTGRSDCAIAPAGAVPAALHDELGGARAVPRPNDLCTIGAPSWTLLWLDGGEVADRVAIPGATCLPADRNSRPDVAFTVTDGLLGELAAFHSAEADVGGAFDGLADADPVAALCARRYPEQLAEMPLALDVVVLGVSPTDPASTPESPGVPFIDVDVLVLDVLAGEAAPRAVLRSLGEPPDDANAVGERLLAANTSPFLSACGFTQPYSRDTAEWWREALG